MVLRLGHWSIATPPIRLTSRRNIYLDGVFIIDRINARAITKKSPPYEVPIIDAVAVKMAAENGLNGVLCLSL